ncbi:hypothetical protein NEOKW01_2109 [Nematocida sp. AWRm80]|nr:hypothetical protein NEOKW01_2109 [Nematocida sp. AWRm80]
MQNKKSRLTQLQKRFLLLVYQNDPRPCKELRRQIAKDFSLPPRTVQIWFQNKRAQERKHANKTRHSLDSFKFSQEIPFLNSCLDTYNQYFSYSPTPQNTEEQQSFNTSINNSNTTLETIPSDSISQSSTLIVPDSSQNTLPIIPPEKSINNQINNYSNDYDVID